MFLPGACFSFLVLLVGLKYRSIKIQSLLSLFIFLTLLEKSGFDNRITCNTLVAKPYPDRIELVKPQDLSICKDMIAGAVVATREAQEPERKHIYYEHLKHYRPYTTKT